MNNKLQQYLRENTGDTHYLVRQLNSLNNCLDHLDFIDMEDLDIYLEGQTPTEIANMIHYGDFNPNHDYFQFNVYANLVSYQSWEVKEEYIDYADDIAKCIIEYLPHISLPTQELQDIIDEMGAEIDAE